jgi:hypothetical protein
MPKRRADSKTGINRTPSSGKAKAGKVFAGKASLGTNFSA